MRKFIFTQSHNISRDLGQSTRKRAIQSAVIFATNVQLYDAQILVFDSRDDELNQFFLRGRQRNDFLVAALEKSQQVDIEVEYDKADVVLTAKFFDLHVGEVVGVLSVVFSPKGQAIQVGLRSYGVKAADGTSATRP